MADRIAGGCFCGAVRFTVEGPPIARRACWCRDCQYLASGNASVNAMFRTAGLTVTGELAEYVSKADSGSTMRRRFCPKCGTQLFSEARERPELVVIRVGAFDNPEQGAPERYIWAASAPSWGLLDPGLPNSEGQPAPIAAR